MWPAVRRLHLRIWLSVGLIQAAALGIVSASIFTVTTIADSGLGSLRSAVSNANFVAGNDQIHFAIPGSGPFTINLLTVLPSIVEPVVIDGTTQSGYAGKPLVAIDGAGAAGHGSGIYILTSNTVIRGLSINRFPRDGIRIETHGGNSIQGNYIGTGPFGTNLWGNGNDTSGVGGVVIAAAGNIVGGPNANERNVISGSNRHGIFLLTTVAVSNIIQGNYIGVDHSGTKRLGNANNGIVLATGAKNNLIGGRNPTERNVISGNGQSGVFLLDGTTTGNVIQGNHIGTEVNGSSALSNASDGITIFGAADNLVGGTVAGAGNLISGNGGRGVLVTGSSSRNNLIQGNHIGTDTTGTVKIPNRFSGVELFNASSNIVGGIQLEARNLISGNLLSGVSLTDSNASGNTVLGNFVGTDASGSNALGNSRSGIFISGVQSNIIGGSAAGTHNLISGNGENGILVTGAGARGNLIQGNLVGTDINGTRRVTNGASGIRLEAPANFIGGALTNARNVISGNANSGVFLYLATASNNVIQGNFIGTTLLGTASLSNGFAGIGLTNAPANLIGGTNAGEGNVISGNHLNGVYLQGRANGNVFQGNFIGTDVHGMNALPNGAGLPIADFAGGIDVSAAAGNRIGGSESGAGNLISANLRNAIAIGDLGATNNVIQGNRIGVKADGVSPLGNEWHGVEIRTAGGGANTVIGGTIPGAGNVLAHATLGQRSGVRIRSASSNTGILVRGNSIYFNGGSGATGLGIDIGAFGVNANDGCDTDTGGNLLQNYPVLTNAQSAGNVTVVRGILNSAPSTTFLLQFYANPIPEPSGLVEGKVFLGDWTVTTDGTCNGAFTALLTNGVPAGQRITATATDPANNTSEFSTNLTVEAAQVPVFAVEPESQNISYGSNVQFTASASGTGTVFYQWRFNGTNLPGATGTSLSLTNLQLANAGSYGVTASNIFGTAASTNALLMVIVSAPTLGASLSEGGEFILTWPADGPPFRVQQATNLAAPIAWSDVTNSPVPANGKLQVSLMPNGQQRFFRLALP